MKKIIFYLEKPIKKSECKERITIQLRSYDAEGNYIQEKEKGNETIHLKNCNLSQAFEIIKSSLMNSPFISKDFEVED